MAEQARELPPQDPEAKAIQEALYVTPASIELGKLALGLTILTVDGKAVPHRDFAVVTSEGFGTYAIGTDVNKLRERIANGEPFNEVIPDLWKAFMYEVDYDEVEKALADAEAAKAARAANVTPLLPELSEEEYAERLEAAVQDAIFQAPSTVEEGELALGATVVEVNGQQEAAINIIRVIEPGLGLYADDEEAEAFRGRTPDGRLMLSASDEMWKAFLLAAKNHEIDLDALAQAILHSGEAA